MPGTMSGPPGTVSGVVPEPVRTVRFINPPGIPPSAFGVPTIRGTKFNGGMALSFQPNTANGTVGRTRLEREDFASDEEFGAYLWAKGTVGEVLLGRMFFQPQPPRRVLDGHMPLAVSNAHAKNLPEDACHLDAVLFNDQTSLVEGILEVKTTMTNKSSFKLRGMCGKYMHLAEANGIPLWFGVVRLKSDFPKEILTRSPEDFIENTDLSPFVSEAFVFARSEFEFTDHRIHYVAGAEPVFASSPSPKRGGEVG